MKLFLFLFCSVSAMASRSLIREAEALRISLPLKDPTRQTLNLRLADILYNECLEGEKDAILSPTKQKELDSYRRQAVELYRNALTGSQGLYPLPNSHTKLKINYQLAKLYDDLAEPEKASPLWQALVKQDESTDLKREAALHIAEKCQTSMNEQGFKCAVQYFNLAGSMSRGTERETYTHYRLAWVYKSRGRFDEALREMNQALYDGKGNIREEALRDLIPLYASSSKKTLESIQAIQTLSDKVGRPQLLLDLANAYLAAGNKTSGVLALATYNEASPSVEQEVKLLEEYYGLRNWEKFRQIREKLARADIGSLPETTKKNIEPTLLRLTVQLDAERITRPAYSEDFQDTVDLYLSIAPKSKDRMKFVTGWLAAEKDHGRRLEKLSTLLQDPRFAWSNDDKRTLSETMASFGKEHKDYAAIIKGMELALATHPSPQKTREYRQLLAGALYDSKQDARALAELASLASGPIDETSAKAEFLKLQILTAQKNFAEANRDGELWLKRVNSAAKAPSLTKSITELTQQSKFQSAVALGESEEALRTFKSLCLAHQLLPKSCANAETLATHLGEENNFIVLLRAQGKQKELASELEAAGYFSEAAKVYGEIGKSPSDIPTLLRMSLLFELGGDEARKMATLNALQAKVAKLHPIPNEKEIFAALSDGGALNASSLSLAWSPKLKCRAAEQLADDPTNARIAEATLMQCKQESGPAWSNLILGEAQKKFDAQSRISFYGKNSQRKFKVRLQKIQELAKFVEQYYPGASAETREKLAGLSAQAYDTLAKEILDTPIPDEVNEEQRGALEASLNKMADPFLKRAEEFKSAVEKSAENTETDEEEPETSRAAKAPTISAKRALEELHNDPSNRDALEAMKAHYDSKGESRLAGYFQGRLLQLEQRGLNR